MTVQFIEIAGQRMAVLPVADYDRLLEATEDRADTVAASRAQARRDAGEEYVPAEVVDRILRGENPLKVWRQHRNLTQAQLAARVGSVASAISKVEAGQQSPDIAKWHALAKALDVTLADIVPAT